jgi:hypothetical protein
MDLAELATRLARLEDLEALRHLKAAYCEACDRGSAAAVVELWLADGVLEVLPDGPAARGHEELLAFYSRLPPRFPFCAHLLANPRLELDGDRASGRWWILMPAEVADAPAAPAREERWLVAEYEDDYARDGERWRIARSRVRPRWLATRAELAQVARR